MFGSFSIDDSVSYDCFKVTADFRDFREARHIILFYTSLRFIIKSCIFCCVDYFTFCFNEEAFTGGGGLVFWFQF